MFMNQLRTSMKENMLCMLVFVFIGVSCIYAEPIAANTVLGTRYKYQHCQDSPICDPYCGCDGMYSYDEVRKECVLNLHKLMKTVEVRYDNEDVLAARKGMAKAIYLEGQKIFRGILVSVILVITCATICVLAAFIYCIRINLSDRKLKQEVKALARKNNKVYKVPPSKSKTVEPKGQSCNVVVEDAGVFVV